MDRSLFMAARLAVGAWLDAITVNKNANGLARVIYVFFFANMPMVYPFFC